MITGSRNIANARLLVLRSALSLEIKGLRRSRGRTAYSIIKSELDFRGSRQKVYDQLDTYIKEQALSLIHI